MQCTKHPEKEATGTCTYCGKFFCEDCLVDINGRNYCREHVSAAIEEQKTATANPSIIINNAASSSASAVSNGGLGGLRTSNKKKMTALLLCIFGGVLGLHRFYVGKVGLGFLYLFTGALCGIGWIVDIIKIATGTFRDAFGFPLTQ